ncbi:hypothetical protein DPMN_103530 [Dreissena polymorpha]|uniref:Uncharacterized protein n=1 Tax=Dreissena polymorpha TaxID=45954 RepID=A0A9D4H883_DREPO|nr:hypothetical protein DPMN_103530 [Dreissena polymorpha]
MSAKLVKILPKSVLCELQEVKVLRKWEPGVNSDGVQREPNKPESEDQKQDFIENLNLKIDHLDPDQQRQLQDLCYKWKDVFSQGPLDLGNTDLVKNEIKLEDERPFKDPYRRIPPALFNEVR